MNNQVLIVDDDYAIRETVRIILESEGYLVFEAENGNQCLDKLRQGFKGLVLMDIMMPQMDGWDIIHTMADQGLLKNIIICMLTAIDEPDSKAEGLQSFVLDYLTKPFEAESLINIVESSFRYLN